MTWEYTIELKNGMLESGFIEAADEKEARDKIKENRRIIFIEESSDEFWLG